MTTTEQTKSKLACLIILKMIKDKCWMSVYQTLSICGESLDKEDRDKILELLDKELDDNLKEIRKVI